MKLFTGWMVLAGMAWTAGAANAQAPAPHAAKPGYSAVSDIGGPYAAMPPEAATPAHGPILLPAPEVYTVLRENGFSPLGIPRQRGFVYTIAVIDRHGDDGRLVIDARNGRIIRFMPAIGRRHFNDDPPATRSLVGPPLVTGALRSPPRPPRSIPRVAGRAPAPPVPRATSSGGEATPQTGTAQQSAALQAKPGAAPTPPQATAAPAVEAKPAPQILPTQDMPKMMDLE